MVKRKEGKYLILACITGLVLLLDIISKWLVYHFAVEARIMPFLTISRVENTGIAFGLMKGYTLLLIILGLAIIALLAYYAKNMPGRKLNIMAISLIAGGALGNLLDRILLGFVRDFIQVFSWFPTFNLADSAITVGAILLIIAELKEKKK